MVKLNQIKEMINSEFLLLESNLDWIQIQIMYMSQYFDHNFSLNYWIEMIPMELES
jgi:hypothetical protein